MSIDQPTGSDDDLDLVAAIRKGDAAALGTYIEQKERPLMAFIHQKLGDGLRRKLEPEDILQEISADAVRSLDDIDLSDRDPFNWLCQLCERRIIDAHRYFFEAQKRDVGKERPLSGGGGSQNDEGGLINLLVASLTTPSQAFRRNAREVALLGALQQLPQLQQDVIRMRYVENRPSKEIAESIGKSDAAVRVMLTRTIKRLQDLLEDQPME